MLREGEHIPVDHTKSEAGNRELYLTDYAQKIIDVCLTYQKQNGGMCEYIFSMTDVPFPTQVIQRTYRKYCHQLNIPLRNSHNARMSYNSALLDSGVNLNTA